MNIQPGRISRSRSSSSMRKDPQIGKQFAFVVKVVLGLVMISSVCVAHIFMKQKITETERHIRAARLNIGRLKTEIVNLRNHYEEKCSYPSIRQQIVRFGLKLVPAEPGQVRRMALYPPRQAARLAAQLEQRGSVVASNSHSHRD